MTTEHAKEYAGAWSKLSDYLEILEPYVGPEPIAKLKDRWLSGIDITDEMYEALAEHDEAASQGWLEDTHLVHAIQ